MTALHITFGWDIHPFLPADIPVLQGLESIKSIGLLHPPLVLQRQNGVFEVVAGSRSLTVFLQANSKPESMYCRILAPDTPERVVLQLLFEEHATSRQVSPIELAHFYRICTDKLTPEDRNNLLAALHLDNTPHTINRITALLQLSDGAQLAMMHGLLSENVARELLKLSNEDRSSLLKLFRQLNSGAGKQKRMLTLLRDLAGRKRKDIREILAQPDIQEILSHPEMNLPQKNHGLLQLLQRLHSPALHHAEHQFKTWQAQLELPENCTVEHSQSFEKDEITLQIAFDNKDQFSLFWPKIKKTLVN